MKYDTWKYLYPPRPKNVITHDILPLYEARGWTAQIKKNGTNSIIAVAPDKTVYWRNRHAENHKSWTCPKQLADDLADRCPSGVWTMMVAEILHLKTVDIKDVVYVHDLIVYQSIHLVGETFETRQRMLDFILPTQGAAEGPNYYVLSKGLWRAKNFTKGFVSLFQGIKNPRVDEGLVLKNPKGQLKWCVKPDANSSWQVKCRYPTKNYQF